MRGSLFVATPRAGLPSWHRWQGRTLSGPERASKRTPLSSWIALVAYVRLALQHEPREQFRVLFSHVFVSDDALVLLMFW